MLTFIRPQRKSAVKIAVIVSLQRQRISSTALHAGKKSNARKQLSVKENTAKRKAQRNAY